MGEGTNDLDPEEQLDQVSERIGKSRARLDDLVSELDQRRHVVANVRRTVSEHPVWAIGSVALGLALIGGGIALAVRRQQQRQTLSARAERLRIALGRMIEKPDKVAPRDGGVAGKVLTSAATAATGVLVKRLVERAVAQAMRADDRTR
jgi:hypothetical protein